MPLLSVFTSAIVPAPPSSPDADGNLATPEENGEPELEPMRNGAGHISETESSDSGVTPGDKENSTGAPQDIEGKLHLVFVTSGTTWWTSVPTFCICQCVYLLIPYLICIYCCSLSNGCPDLAEPSGKRQYNREFLLGFQFMPACIQKPEGLPPISDVVLDKVQCTQLCNIIELYMKGLYCQVLYILLETASPLSLK